MKKYISILCLALLVLSCSKKDNITKAADYNVYLAMEGKDELERVHSEIAFWNTKIQPDSIQLIALAKLGGLYTQFFDQTGDITYLRKAEAVWQKSTEVAALKKASYQQALARNLVTQHRFQEALKVLENTEEGFATSLQLFDVHLELGNNEKAKTFLDTWKDKESFDVLIRLSKWNDHKGDLDTAIAYLESAATLIENETHSARLAWAYSNLADYYGHAGRIQDSYDYYLKTLQIDPHYSYALKGIAWIVFSHEKNAEEAIRIVEQIAKQKNTPDVHLLLADFATYNGNLTERLKHLQTYAEQVNNPEYGIMYDTYSIELLSEEKETAKRALELASREVALRPTAEVYSLLALAQLKDDMPAAAMNTIETYVKGQSYEPMVQFRMAQVYKANGQIEEVRQLKEELLDASYELGPLVTMAIKAL